VGREATLKGKSSDRSSLGNRGGNATFHSKPEECSRLWGNIIPRLGSVTGGERKKWN